MLGGHYQSSDCPLVQALSLEPFCMTSHPPSVRGLGRHPRKDVRVSALPTLGASGLVHAVIALSRSILKVPPNKG